MDLKKRLSTEAAFFDSAIDRQYADIRSYGLSNSLNYQQLFAQIPQLAHLVDFFGDISGRRILDAGCGNGWTALYFARSGAEVFACDVSPRCVETAKRHAEANGLAERLFAQCMPAERLAFPDGFFDFVFMNAALHHCDIALVSREFQRVLRPGGKVAVVEDYAYHPLMNLYRFLTPSRHTPSERPLGEDEIREFVSPFARWHTYHFQLFDLLDRNGWPKRVLSSLDRFLLNRIPALKRYCRLVAIHAQK